MTGRYSDDLCVQLLLEYRRIRVEWLHELSSGRLKAHAKWNRESQFIARVYWMVVVAALERDELAASCGVSDASAVMCRIELETMLESEERALRWKQFGVRSPSHEAIDSAIQSVSRLVGRPSRQAISGDRLSHLVLMYSQMGIVLSEDNLSKILKRYCQLPKSVGSLFDDGSRVVRRRRRALKTFASSLAEALYDARKQAERELVEHEV